MTRLAQVRQKMAERGANAAVVDEVEHVAYLCGYAPRGTMYQPYIVPQRGEPIMVLRSLDLPTFAEQSWTPDALAYRDWDDPVDVAGRALTALGVANGRIALELDSHFLTVQRYERLKAVLPEATFVDFSGVLWDLRLRKSSEEIGHLRRAADIATHAFMQALEAVKVGKSERAVVAAAYAAALSLGADNSWVAIIASGERTNSLHGRLGDRLLQEGDMLHIEMLPQVYGYTARFMRPIAIGHVSETRRHVARRLIEIQDQQIAAMRVGAAARDIDRICREQVLGAGLRETIDNVTGYTLGYIPGVGAPRTSDFTRVFHPSAEWTLEEGMVFHMYISADGMTFSETVLVRADGAERLTRVERQLFVCPR